MNKVFLGLGSNIGNKKNNINKVIEFFRFDNRFNELQQSSIYETKAYGNIKQENFLNGVISFYTNITLDVLFDIVKELENRIGRKKREKWGPREIDIDILLYGDSVVRNDKLSIPHKDLLNRDFVIVPLIEIDETIIHPVKKKNIKSFLSKLNDKYIISKIN